MRRRSVALALHLALLGSGCGLVGPLNTGPDGLSSYDGDLRRLTRLGRFEKALTFAEEEADDAGDELLALLNQAVVEHYAGHYEASNEHLQAADLIIDQRFTKSVSRAALSLVTSDRALVWLPGRSEQLMIHVYGALNYLALDQPAEAAVEARRLSMLLAELTEDGGAAGLRPAQRRLYYSLHYFAGAVFEQAGETNAARVSYRLADATDADTATTDTAGSPALGKPGDTAAASPALGEVVILVESGFVAHRVEQSASLLVGLDELDGLRYGPDLLRLRNARCFSRNRIGYAMSSWGAATDASCSRRHGPRLRGARYSKHDDDDDDVAYLLRVAWPTMRRPLSSAPIGPVYAFSGTRPPSTLSAPRDATALAGTGPAVEAVRADSTTSAPPPPETDDVILSADLSGAVIGEFNQKAPGILVKSVARAALKYSVVQAVEDGIRDDDDEDEALADIVAVLGNAVAALTERADTRSWTLLPARLQIVRLRLPPGSHDIRLAALNDASDPLELGRVDVRPGELTVLSVRAWP